MLWNPPATMLDWTHVVESACHSVRLDTRCGIRPPQCSIRTRASQSVRNAEQHNLMRVRLKLAWDQARVGWDPARVSPRIPQVGDTPLRSAVRHGAFPG